MLGWEIIVFRQTPYLSLPYEERNILARWQTGISGLDWINDLVEKNKAVAVDLLKCGYPHRYSTTAGIFLPIISSGVPKNESSSLKDGTAKQC